MQHDYKIARAATFIIESLEQRQLLSASISPAIAGSISGPASPTTAASSYNLTVLGTSDWAHWGSGGNASSFVHDASGGSQISNVTDVGAGNYGGWMYVGRDVSWTNGTPTASSSGDDGYIWANNVLGAGFSFTVPADTQSRTLTIDLGGYSSAGMLTASLSDNSVLAYSIEATGTSNYTDTVSITYNSASAGQTLTITYTKYQNIGAAGGSVDLDSAWMTSQPAPVITRNPASVTEALPTLDFPPAPISPSPLPPPAHLRRRCNGRRRASVMAIRTAHGPPSPVRRALR